MNNNKGVAEGQRRFSRQKELSHMANVLLVGPEPSTLSGISAALATDGHHVRYTSERIETTDITGVDIIFADGEPWHYIRALLHVREVWPWLPFVVVIA